jgi:hypothetical protein
VRDGAEVLSMVGNSGGDQSFFVDLTLAPESWSPTPNATGLPESPRALRSASATVGGRPAVVVTADRITRVTWSPIAGLRAELSVRGPVSASEGVAFAGTLSLGRGHPCDPHLRPTVLPADARITGCSISQPAGIGEYTIRGPGGVITVVVWGHPFPYGISPGAYDGPPPTLSNGWAYQELDASANTQHYTAHIRVPDPYVDIWAQGTYNLSDVLVVGGGMRPS